MFSTFTKISHKINPPLHWLILLAYPWWMGW